MKRKFKHVAKQKPRSLFDEVEDEARAPGLTDGDIDAELKAWRAERKT